MITPQTLDLARGAVRFETEQLTKVADGTEAGSAAMAQPAQPSTTHDNSTVPVKQLLRWQDDGGALPPAR